MEKINKRELFENALKRILAVQLPRTKEERQIIYLLFNDEEILKQAIFFIKDYETIGFSLIIEKINDVEALIKLHDIESDDFYTSDEVAMQKGLMDDYKNRIDKNTVMSFGVLTRLNNQGQIRIDYATQHQVNLKSVVIREAAK